MLMVILYSSLLREIQIDGIIILDTIIDMEIIGNSMEVIILDIKDHLDLEEVGEGEEDFKLLQKKLLKYNGFNKFKIG